MNINSLAVVIATLDAIVQARVIRHDKVAPFPATIPNSITDIIAAIYQPQIYINNGCHPYPAVNAKGDTSGGLNPTGFSNSDCTGSRLGSQVYGRSAWYNGVGTIMYSWYFPKDSPLTLFGHHHDWEHAIVWIGNFTKLPAKILAMTSSAHSGYNAYVSPMLTW